MKQPPNPDLTYEELRSIYIDIYINNHDMRIPDRLELPIAELHPITVIRIKRNILLQMQTQLPTNTTQSELIANDITWYNSLISANTRTKIRRCFL